ncbi:MAG: hypothetical protein K5848_05440, partial [Lachnospiraceae bacterium]|nr:hypothetical protein [Lachnospiraceae bacterium]
ITAIPGILLIAVPMIDGRTPEWFALSCLVIGCIIIINEADAKERFFETFLRVGLIALAFLVSGVIFSGRAEDFLEKAEDAKRFQSTLEEKLKIALGQNGYSTMFIDNTDLKYSGSVQMTVEIETDTIPSSSLYYKNFTGQDYTLGAWNRAGADFDETFEDKYYDDMDLKEVRRALAQNIYDYVDLGYTSSVICNVKTVYKTDASTSIPYYSHINNDYLDLLEGDVNPTIETSYDTIELPLVIAPKETESLVEPLLQRVRFESSGLSVNGTNFFRAYNRFVQDHYMGYDIELLPDDIAKSDMDGDSWEYYTNDLDSESMNNRNESRLYIALYLKDYFEENYEYTTKFDNLGYGEDAIEYFVEDSKEGCCRHFASAATLMLRQAGVPARYASGYIVKPSMFEFGGSGIKATVKDYSEHAWVEVYFDNLGWVPFEFTPGYDPGIEGLPTEKNFDPDKKFRPASKKREDTPTPKPTEEPKEDTPTPKQEEPTKAPGATNTPRPKKTATPVPTGTGKGGNGTKTGTEGKNGRINPLMRGVIIAAIIAIVLFMAILLVMKKSSDMLLRDIRSKSYRKAVKRMNRRVYRKLVASGKMTSGAPDSVFREAVAEKTGDKKLADCYMETVIKAAFSEKEITKADADLVYKVYKGKKKK